MSRFFYLLTLCLLAASPCAAAISPILPDLQGAPHSPLDTQGRRAVVLIFMGDDCPISNSYAPEINRLYAAYGSQIAFTLVNTDTHVTAEAVRQHARDYHLRCPTLLDSAHALAKYAGATVTPEAVIYSPMGRLLYRGRIDNRYLDFGKTRYAATTHDLRDALRAVAAGKPVPHPETHPVGCFL